MADVTCRRCGQTREGLARPPMPGALGTTIQSSICAACWEEWTRAEAAGLHLGTVVVMLDGHLHCRELAATHPDTVIHWGAYVGMPQQELRSGRLADVIDEIVELRARLRERHGWVMDVYALGSASAPVHTGGRLA